jgi:hypothetical protein
VTEKSFRHALQRQRGESTSRLIEGNLRVRDLSAVYLSSRSSSRMFARSGAGGEQFLSDAPRIGVIAVTDCSVGHWSLKKNDHTHALSVGTV